jgi:hypothetical protein
MDSLRRTFSSRAPTTSGADVMGDLMLLPALLLPVIAVIGWIATSRRPGGRGVLRRQGRYARNNLVLGIILAVLVIAFGYRTR